MFQMTSFSMNTCTETFVPLLHCIIDDTLSQAMPDLRQTLLKFIDVMKLTIVANVSVHGPMPKEDILEFNVTQEYTNKLIWLILSTTRQNGDIVLDRQNFAIFVIEHEFVRFVANYMDRK